MKKLAILMALIALTSCGPRRPGKVGPAGQDGLDGLNGQDGIQGAKGDKGDKGEAGQDAEITTVKFCPNLIDSYGTQYSEYGVCINNKVYAVYSTNNQSFLTELSAGRYTTTTPFGNCQFTVVEGSCEVE